MILSGQGLAGTAPAVLLTLPAGPCSVTLVNGGSISAYVGAGTSVSTANGCPLPVGVPVSLAGYPGGGPTPLSVATLSGTAPVGFVVSSAAGGTGR